MLLKRPSNIQRQRAMPIVDICRNELVRGTNGYAQGRWPSMPRCGETGAFTDVVSVLADKASGSMPVSFGHIKIACVSQQKTLDRATKVPHRSARLIWFKRAAVGGLSRDQMPKRRRYDANICG